MDYSKEIKELIEKAESLGWSVVEEDKKQYFFSKFSPRGQDFSITVEGEDAKELIENIHEVYDNYDVSEEAYLWFNNTGCGKNGAPFDMKDAYDDMEACEQMILELYDTLKWIKC